MQFQFNARGYAPIQGAEQWPDGWYKIVITGHDIKRTNKNDGTRLVFNVTAQDGAMAGKTNFIGLNIENPNPVAVQMAYETLAAICWVAGKPAINDLNELTGIPFYGHCTKSEQGNNFRMFKDVNGNDAVNIAGQNGGMTTRQAQAPQGQPQQPGGFQQPPGGTPFGQAPGAAPPAQGNGQWQPQGQPQMQQPGQQPQGGQPGQQPWQAPPAGGQPAQGQWQAPPAGPAQGAPQGQPGGWGGGQPAQGQPQGGAAPGWSPGGAAPGGAAPWGAPRQ